MKTLGSMLSWGYKAWNLSPLGKGKQMTRRNDKLERDATKETLANLGPFFVVVDGGTVQYVGNAQVDLLNTGQADIIDFDNIEADPDTTWSQLSLPAQQFFAATYPDDMKKYGFKIEAY
jgi:hypothetical protein